MVRLNSDRGKKTALFLLGVVWIQTIKKKNDKYVKDNGATDEEETKPHFGESETLPFSETRRARRMIKDRSLDRKKLRFPSKRHNDQIFPFPPSDSFLPSLNGMMMAAEGVTDGS